jgi:hypothetical protein
MADQAASDEIGNRIRPESGRSIGIIGLERQFLPISLSGRSLFCLRQGEACGKNRPLGRAFGADSIFPGMLP